MTRPGNALPPTPHAQLAQLTRLRNLVAAEICKLEARRVWLGPHARGGDESTINELTRVRAALRDKQKELSQLARLMRQVERSLAVPSSRIASSRPKRVIKGGKTRWG